MDLVNIRKKAKIKAQGNLNQTEPEQSPAIGDGEVPSEQAPEAAEITTAVDAGETEVEVEAAVETEKPKKKKKTKKKKAAPPKKQDDEAEDGDNDIMDFGAFETDSATSEEPGITTEEEESLAAAVQKMLQEPPEPDGEPQMPVAEKADRQPAKAPVKATEAVADESLEQFVEQFANCEAEDEAMEFLRLANAQLSNQLDSEREEEELEDLVELICFALEDEEYAIRLQDVREVIKMKNITVVPKAPVYIPGIISLRGQIIPVFDLRKRVGLATKEFDRFTRIIVVNSNGEKVGLIVDVITGVARINEKLIEPTPAVISGIEASFISGVGRYQGRMLIILNLPRVIDTEADSE